jgi:hypothetical protein
MIDPRKESPPLRRAQQAYIAAVIDEIMPPLRLAAKAQGYALAVHGSMARDIDLVAIPWTEHAHTPDLMISNFRGILAGIFGSCYVSKEPTVKPQGRMAWMFHSHTMNAEIDLSVMPLLATPDDEQASEPIPPINNEGEVE